MTRPVEQVLSEFTFPFKLRPHQAKAVDESADYNGMLIADTVGYGKTATGTAIALYHTIANGAERILILAPPVLLNQWYRWLESISELRGLTCLYRGTPAQRKKMNLKSDILLMTYEIFKRDFKVISKQLAKHAFVILADELSLKDQRTKIHKTLRMAVYGVINPNRLNDGLPVRGHRLIALNATPISKREHIYPWCAVFAPAIYRSWTQFLNIHAERQDNYGKVLSWTNTELMDDNLNFFQYKSPEGVVEIPETSYNSVQLELSPKHAKIYNATVEAELSVLPDTITELARRSLFATLQRLVTAPQTMDLDITPPIYDYIDSYLDQIDDERVIIFTMFNRTIDGLINHIGAGNVAVIRGGQTAKMRQQNFDIFENKDVQVMLVNIQAGGHGLNLQFCRRVLFAEIPYTGSWFRQSSGRVVRQGQQRSTFVDIPYAIDTIQQTLYHRMIAVDEDISKASLNKKTIREMLYGG